MRGTLSATNVWSKYRFRRNQSVRTTFKGVRRPPLHLNDSTHPKVHHMNTSSKSSSKPRTHPLVIAASATVLLLSATVTAGVLGWLPSSLGRTPSPEAVATVAPQPAASHHTYAQAAPETARQRSHNWLPRTAAQPCRNCGVVESMRELTSNVPDSGLGAAGGAVVGGLLGNQVGGGHGREAMTVVGAIGGALAGNQIEKQVRTTHSYQTTVRMDDGSARSTTQETQPAWRNGDAVKVINGVVSLNS
jgi:outer membrane lipoprotein SlyB